MSPFNSSNVSNTQFDYYYYAILATIALKSISFIPIIQDMKKNRNADNVPYLTLFINLFATLVLVVIALLKGYYVQLIFFLIFFITLVYTIILKARFDKYNQ